MYKVFHEGLAVHRALKVIRPDLAEAAGFTRRFQQEAQAVAGLRHPNIVQMHDFGSHEDLYYMVMELVEGEDLKERITRLGPIRPCSEAVRLTAEVGSALGYAHSKGIVHRDVKPSNVLVNQEGQAILTDFGIAKILSSDVQLTETGTGIGTPSYMAPEQAKGEVELGPSSDIYALGVMLYEMLTGRVPFIAETPLAVIFQVINDPVPSPRELSNDIPEALQEVLLKAMAKEPDERYETVQGPSPTPPRPVST